MDKNNRPGDGRRGQSSSRSSGRRISAPRRAPRPRRAILFENTQAARYNKAAVDRFISGLSDNGFTVERVHPENSREMVERASDARKKKPYLFVAAGGDGTVNLVARTLVGSPFRFAVLPFGKCDNFFRSHVGAPTPENALAAILNGQTRSVDCGRVSKLPFFCSIGLGLLPALTDALKGRSMPRFGIGWSRLAGKIEPEITRQATPIKIDSFRFNISPKTLSVNIIPYSAGIPLAPGARADDEKFDVTMDMSSDSAELGKYLRELLKGTCNFTGLIRMYRGKEISIGSVKGRRLYLDGEILEIPTSSLEITLYPKKLRVLSGKT